MFNPSELFGPLLLSLPMTEGAPEAGRLIAVAALRLDEASEISVHAAHAPNFLLYDHGGHLREVLPNPYLTDHTDAAQKVAELLRDKKVRLLIAGHFGPHLKDALDGLGIGHIEDMGIANIAVRTAEGT